MKTPNKTSIDFFNKKILNDHSSIENYIEINSCFYEIKKHNQTSLMVLLTDIYILDMAACQEIISDYPNINCIVLSSKWNGYEDEAKSFLNQRNIAIFKMDEFKGALNFEGSKFINYSKSR